MDIEEIEVEITEPWRNGRIATDLAGFGSRGVSPAMLFGLPIRRSLAQPWFKPIARIGATGSDEYPLDPTVAFAPGDDKKMLVTELTARTSGELFLYVNDAVIGLPFVLDVFYRNNHGRAKVTVARVRPLAAPWPGPFAGAPRARRVGPVVRDRGRTANAGCERRASLDGVARSVACDPIRPRRTHWRVDSNGAVGIRHRPTQAAGRWSGERCRSGGDRRRAVRGDCEPDRAAPAST